MYPHVADTVTPELLGLAVAIGMFGFVWRAAADGAPVGRLFAGALLVALGGVVGGRLYWLAEQGWNVSWAEMFLPGLRHPGIVGGVLVTMPLAAWLLPVGRPLTHLADLAAMPTGVAFAIGRLGCFVAGCCFGVRTEVPWAVRFPADSPAARLHEFRGWITADAAASAPVHPLQLYFALLALGVALVTWRFERRRQYAGQVFLLFLALHETGKFLLEFLREPELGTVHATVSAASLGIAVAAGATLAAIALRDTARARRRAFAGAVLRS